MIDLMDQMPDFQLWKGGQNLTSRIAPYFITASLTDEVGQKNDQLEVTLADRAAELPLPREDDLLTAYSKGVLLGAFKVNRWGRGWDGGPETMTLTARAATMTGDLKALGSRHWDNATLGEILEETAQAGRLRLAIDPDLARIRLPYTLRWEASPIDFATRLVGEYGGAVKPAGGKLAIVKKGSGKGAGGAALPVIRVQRLGNNGWHIEGEPRPRQGKVRSAWTDPKTGRRKLESKDTGRDGPAHTLIHPRASKAEAEAAAEANARETNMLSGGGFFTVPFDPANVAGAQVVASGFGEGVDGTWASESIETTWAKGTPTLSTINVTAEPEGKGDGSKDDDDE